MVESLILTQKEYNDLPQHVKDKLEGKRSHPFVEVVYLKSEDRASNGKYFGLVGDAGPVFFDSKDQIPLEARASEGVYEIRERKVGYKKFFYAAKPDTEWSQWARTARNLGILGLFVSLADMAVRWGSFQTTTPVHETQTTCYETGCVTTNVVTDVPVIDVGKFLTNVVGGPALFGGLGGLGAYIADRRRKKKEIPEVFEEVKGYRRQLHAKGSDVDQLRTGVENLTTVVLAPQLDEMIMREGKYRQSSEDLERMAEEGAPLADLKRLHLDREAQIREELAKLESISQSAAYPPEISRLAQGASEAARDYVAKISGQNAQIRRTQRLAQQAQARGQTPPSHVP